METSKQRGGLSYLPDIELGTIVFFDLESDGLYNECTKIHCISYSLGLGGEVHLAVGEEEVRKAIEMLDKAPRVCAHNGRMFDCPVIKKLYGVRLAHKCVDTLVMSCLSKPDRPGGHRLKDLAKTFGGFKGDFTGPWDTYTEEMGQYCLQDTEALVAVYLGLVEEMQGWDWHQAFNLESHVADIIAHQERTGWTFDTEAANRFISDMDAKIESIDRALEHLIKPKIIKKGTRKNPVAPFTAAGERSKVACDWAEESGYDVDVVGGPFFPIEVVKPDLGSRVQMIEVLMEHGWKPTEYTEKGSPKFTEDSIVGHLGEVGQLICDRFVAVTRRSQVQGWVSKTRSDGRIEAGAAPNGTPTARMRHRVVVNVPRVTSAYGTELRSLFTCAHNLGRVQGGADASSLELRMLAHYMKDPAYTDAVVNGKSSEESDVHSVNAVALGFQPKQQLSFNAIVTSGRDLAKTFIYALLYGAGDGKIGSLVGEGAEGGRRLRKKFIKAIPKMAELNDKVQEAAKKGYIKGIDGRKIYIRHKHAALNSLLQSAGSICVKMALVMWFNAMIKAKIPFELNGTFHDEIQFGVKEEDAQQAGEFFKTAMQKSGERFNLTCPLTGEYIIGTNWAQCH